MLLPDHAGFLIRSSSGIQALCSHADARALLPAHAPSDRSFLAYQLIDVTIPRKPRRRYLPTRPPALDWRISFSFHDSAWAQDDVIRGLYSVQAIGVSHLAAQSSRYVPHLRELLAHVVGEYKSMRPMEYFY